MTRDREREEGSPLFNNGVAVASTQLPEIAVIPDSIDFSYLKALSSAAKGVVLRVLHLVDI